MKIPLLIILFILSGSSMFAQENPKAPVTKQEKTERSVDSKARIPRLIDLHRQKGTLAEVDKEGNPKLLPNRLYQRWEPLAGKNGNWVFDLADSEGRFGKPGFALLPNSTLPGEWVGGPKGTRWLYEGDPKVGWDAWKSIPADGLGRYVMWEFGDDAGAGTYFHSPDWSDSAGVRPPR